MAATVVFIKCFVCLLLLDISRGEINGRLRDDSEYSPDLDALYTSGRDPPVQNAILTHPRRHSKSKRRLKKRYKCYSCEPPDCLHEPPSASHMCQNALQCWKSRVRDSQGGDRVSRGCTDSHDTLPVLCTPNSSGASAAANHNSNAIGDGGHGSSPQKRHTIAPRYNIECCQGDYCNGGDFPELPPIVTADDVTFMETTTGHVLKLATTIVGPVLLIGGLACFVWYLMRRSHHKRLLTKPNKQDPETYYAGDDFRATSAGDSTLREYLQHSMTSGSGGGQPHLIQRTMSKQVTLLDCIGKGRYGEVWKGVFHGEYVAVKVFPSRDEQSWKRETEIYRTVLLGHENILGYIGSDMASIQSYTQLWLVTHFYPNGSLYDHLNRTTLSHQDMALICQSIANGLLHLHTEIHGTAGKPAIVHRDLKSKNILVHADGSCVIADFGLAVLHTQSSGKIDFGSNPRVGTKRYMAPEVLNETINMMCLESLRRADIYALGLIMWEVCRRTVSNGVAEEYQIPFYDAPADPSFEEMKKIVCDLKIRPTISNHWSADWLLTEMSKLMAECWHNTPVIRPTALRLKKKIQKLTSSDNLKMNEVAV